MSATIPTFSLSNELTIITGACGGLSHSLIHTLLAYNAPLALFDRNLDALKKTKDEMITFCIEELKIKSENIPRMECYACNIADAKEVELACEAVFKDFGTYPIHLVNTAGYCENFPAEEYPPTNAENLIKVNLLGSLYIAQSFAKPLIENNIRGGSIVMVGSMSGVIVNDPQPQIAYNMSKAGVIHMVKSLAVEWAKYGIRVNTLSPGYIATPLTKNVINGNADMYNRWVSMVPMQRMSEPAEFSGSILYLLSNSASSYTTGENIMVDGGYQCW
jgi:D-arabinitol 2-dehydrogenase